LPEVAGPDVRLYEELLRRAVDELREMVSSAIPHAKHHRVR
jgi:hypothetical protein